MSVEAMKQALEALERGRSQIIGVLVQQDQDEAISALRQAIEQAEDAVTVEREACAKLLENGRFLHDEAPAKILAKEAAKAIRARGEK